VNRLRILKDFGELARKERLDSDEVRLYLLLLANCRTWKHVDIEYRAIKSALGKQFSVARLKRACRRLSGHGLIEIISPLDEITAKDFAMTYRIFPLAGR